MIDDTNPEDLSHVKAIFFDEWDGNYIWMCGWLCPGPRKRLTEEVSICWIAPSSSYQSSEKSKENEIGEDFLIIQLALNLRNTKEISEKAMVVGEQSFFRYVDGLSKPPPNFPKGPSPIYVKSFDEAIFQARSMTNKGILVVSEKLNINVPTNEKMKYYHFYRKEFSAAENPVDFLIEGNILVTSRNYTSGFEWPIVIYRLDENDKRNVELH